MTDRERFNRQMHYESVDRCFNMEFGYWDENFTEWALFRDNKITNNDEADEFFSFKQGPIISLDWYRKVAVPRYKRIGRKLKDAGIDIWYTDCDGDVRPLVPGMLEAGLNTMFPFEVNCAGHPAAVVRRPRL